MMIHGHWNLPSPAQFRPSTSPETIFVKVDFRKMHFGLQMAMKYIKTYIYISYLLKNKSVKV